MIRNYQIKLDFILTTLLLVSIPIIVSANQSDSLIQNYESLSGKEKIEKISNYVNKNKNIFPDLSLKYANDAVALAKKIGDKELTIKSKVTIAVCYKANGDYQLAIEHLSQALSIAKQKKLQHSIASVSIALGDVYALISKYNEALNLNLEALKINKDLDDIRGIAESYHNIAIIYYYFNLNKARDYIFQALEQYTLLKDSVGIAKSLSNIALIYIDFDSLDKAIDYNFKALALQQKIGNTDGVANAYANLGKTYINKKNYDEALKYLNLALDIFQGRTYLRNRFLVMANISDVYLQKHDYQKALQFAQEGYEIASNSQSPDLLAIVYHLYSNIYIKLNDYENAYKYEKSFIAIRDSIFNEENRNKISELEVRIETENKTLENELLRKTNRLQLILFIGAVFFVIVIVLILYNRYKTKKLANQLLEEKNKLITDQNISLERLNIELNEANVAKDKFFSIMAHDLKSPLWWFKNVTELLSNKFDELSKEKIMEITKVLDDSAQTSLHLIENLLQWSRSQSGRIEFIPEKINLSHIFKHIMAHYRIQSEEKNIEVIINVPENSEVIADKNMLYSILRNLISNSIKFSHVAGIITIDFKDEPKQWSVSVSDKGVGISPEEIPKIFRIDVQTTTLGTAQETGTGLGLIITKEFVEKHNGTLNIESTPGEGSKVIFTIPKQ